MKLRRPALLSAVAGLLLLAAATAVAATTPIVRSAHNAALNKTIVVDARGRTLYRLSGDSPTHLKCTASCTGFWPPLTVRSRHVRLRAGKGVHGRLAVFRRKDGTFQVTLAGHPLYRFSGDSAKGMANGQGIKSFGGTWSTVAAGSSTSAAPAPAPAPAPSPYPTY
jgi:predicted lipoprotein with Yx(FWY)xxD motif